MKNLLKLAFGLLFSATVAFAHSDAFKPAFVDTLVAPYLTVQKGLADDNLDVAQKGALHFLDAMKAAPHEGNAHAEANALMTPAKNIANAADIQSARKAFLPLSNEMISLIEHVGTSGDSELFVAHCPMAFNNTGGDWIQADKTVSNPYYGAMMLRCGGIQKALNGPSDKTMDTMPSMNGHEGHSMMQKPKAPVNQTKLDAIHAGVPGYETKQKTTSSKSMGCCEH